MYGIMIKSQGLWKPLRSNFMIVKFHNKFEALKYEDFLFERKFKSPLAEKVSSHFVFEVEED